MAGSGRQLTSLALVATFSLCSLSPASAAETGSGSPAANPQGSPGQWKNHPKGEGEAVNRPEFENVRRALDSLTPEQRQRFKENIVRWMNLSPEEKKALRDREEQRRKKMAEEVEAAIKETGLTLDSAQREQFVHRYAEERLKVEQRLHKEMEEKRKPLVRQIIAQLKAEFSAGAPPAGTSSSATPAPGTAIQTAAPH